MQVICCGRLFRVEEVVAVGSAFGAVAFCGWHPGEAGFCVEDDRKVLRRSANLDSSDKLRDVTCDVNN